MLITIIKFIGCLYVIFWYLPKQWIIRKIDMYRYHKQEKRFNDFKSQLRLF